MDFRDALSVMREGKRVRRAKWNTAAMWIAYQSPTGRITHPFLAAEYLKCLHDLPGGCGVPWVPSQDDMLADDWLVEGTPGG